ncbi:MAG TPA: hypothetical protein PKA82_06420 [Pyrinomonadaceae bacterium]|nr:hypothetical protein [Pyrinomonadaceae bacterium]
MATKYDTNPLDPEFPEKVRAQAEAAAATSSLHVTNAETQAFGALPTAATEERTRRFGEADFQAYQQPAAGTYVPAAYSPANFTTVDQSSSRKVEKLGIPENIAIALPYIPWYLGLIAGVVLLVMLPRSETKVRFHAAQGLAAHVGILLVTFILGAIGNATDVADIANGIFQLVTTIMLIVFAIKAWKGKPVHIESIEDLTNWFDEKIDSKLLGNK